MPFPATPKAPRAPGAPPFRPRPSFETGAPSIAKPPRAGIAPPMPGQKPNFRQMGGKTVPMMADGGGIGIPGLIGGGSTKGAPPPPDPDQDQDQDSGPGAGAVVKPEAVNYHDQLQRCDGCSNYGQDGNCAVLQMQVSPEGGCNAYDDAGGGAGDEGEGGMPPEGADVGGGGPQ